jgi:predicted secreted protein
MTITAALVLYAVIWFLSLFVALPIGLRTQGEENDVVEGTPSSAPADPMIRKKIIWVTVIATLIWAVIASTVLWSGITIRDIDFFGRM